MCIQTRTRALSIQSRAHTYCTFSCVQYRYILFSTVQCTLTDTLYQIFVGHTEKRFTLPTVAVTECVQESHTFIWELLTWCRCYLGHRYDENVCCTLPYSLILLFWIFRDVRILRQFIGKDVGNDIHQEYPVSYSAVSNYTTVCMRRCKPLARILGLQDKLVAPDTEFGHDLADFWRAQCSWSSVTNRAHSVLCGKYFAL